MRSAFELAIDNPPTGISYKDTVRLSVKQTADANTIVCRITHSACKFKRREKVWNEQDEMNTDPCQCERYGADTVVVYCEERVVDGPRDERADTTQAEYKICAHCLRVS
jgi:hypothetical protein